MNPFAIVVGIGLLFSIGRSATSRPSRRRDNAQIDYGPVRDRVPVDVRLDEIARLERPAEQRLDQRPTPQPQPQPGASDSEHAALELLGYVANTPAVRRDRIRVISLQERMGRLTNDGLVGPQTNRRVHELTGLWIPGVRR